MIPSELLRRLWADPRARSRNHNFARYRDDRVYRRAVTHVRALLSFRQDLERYRGRSDIAVKPYRGGGGARIDFRIPELRFRRTLFVSSPELELLRGDPLWNAVEVVG